MGNYEELIKRLRVAVDVYEVKGEIICDPFMGIGGCGVSCKKLNRNFIGIELDENYFNIAKKRIEEAVYE